MEQSYQHHVRYYAPHHFVFYPVSTAMLATSVYFSCIEKDPAIWIFASGLLVLIIWLSFMLRQHYALTLQNRIVRLELRYRYFTLTGQPMEVFEDEFNDSQLFALRFASDGELPGLVERVRAEKLDGDTIKKSIKDWRADRHRV